MDANFWRTYGIYIILLLNHTKACKASAGDESMLYDILQNSCNFTAIHFKALAGQNSI